MIKNDNVYSELRLKLNDAALDNTVPVTAAEIQPADDRRAQLLAQRRNVEQERARRERGDPGTDVVGMKIDEEITRW